jgi:hypothetical protein
MTLFEIVLVLGGAPLGYGLATLKNEIARRRQKLLALPPSDDDVVNYLEASCETNDLARKLLGKVNEVDGTVKLLPAPKPVQTKSSNKPKHYHEDIHGGTGEDSWNFFCDDFCLEDTDVAKLKVLKAWMQGRNSQYFTQYEYVQIMKMLNTPKGREDAREILHEWRLPKPKKAAKKDPPSPPEPASGKE